MGAVAVFPTFQMPPVIRWLKALVNLARDVAADAIIGGSTYTKYNNANAYLGVGNGTTAFSAAYGRRERSHGWMLTQQPAGDPPTVENHNADGHNCQNCPGGGRLTPLAVRRWAMLWTAVTAWSKRLPPGRKEANRIKSNRLDS
jgi:hypothetical protein